MKMRLLLLAHGRSGDKGDTVNIGIISRRSQWYPELKRQLTAERVKEYLSPLDIGDVERYDLDNLEAFNFVIAHALSGGGAVSLRLDAQGKTYAQALLRLPMDVPDNVGREVLEAWGDRLPRDGILTTDQAPV